MSDAGARQRQERVAGDRDIDFLESVQTCDPLESIKPCRRPLNVGEQLIFCFNWYCVFILSSKLSYLPFYFA